MKRIKLIISAVCVCASLIICAVMVHFSNKNFVEDVFLGSNIEQGVDEYFINQGPVKYPERDKGIWLVENKGTDFEKDSEKLGKVLKKLEKSVFDTVYLKSEYFSSPDGEDEKNQTEKIEDLTTRLKQQGKKVFLEMHTDCDKELLLRASEFCDGIILFTDKKMSAERFNLMLSGKVKDIKKQSPEAKVYVSLSLDYDISKLNKKTCDGVVACVRTQKDMEALPLWDKTLKLSDSNLICSINIDTREKTASFPLSALYETRVFESLSAVAFSDYESVNKDVGRCFSAVEEYFEKGIVPEIALRELSVTGYDGNAVSTHLFTQEIEIYGSNLYPCYLDGREIDLGEKGSKKITFNLNAGENKFTFRQCGKEIIYKVNMDFDGEIIRAVLPGEEIYVQPKEKITVTVIAYTGAEVTVKLGTKEYKAECEAGAPTGYAAFTAKIKMPSSRAEVESLGMITVIGSLGERTVQEKGAMIYCAEEMTTVTTSPSQETESTTAIQLGNFVQELIGDDYEYTPPITVPPVFQSTTQHIPVYETLTGNAMCVITEPYADTRPLIYNDDTYTPALSPLIQGTMDYVTAKSSAYNSSENETVYFYELASGRKVKCDHAQLISHSPGDNTISVISSSSENGTLTIRLKTDWKVPYAITHTPQSYYTAHGSNYNLNNFSAYYVQIEFFHTTSVTGNVDTKGSNVVSSADWSVYENQNKAVLYMPLISTGKYYGASVEYDAQGYMVIKIHNNPQTLRGSVILLDPGHGGEDPGALGIGKQVHESDINLAVAYAVRNELQARGATVYLTRQGNETLSLEERKAIARDVKPDLFVSIHSNGSERSSDIGTSVYYYKSFSRALAGNIYDEMIKVFKNNLYYGRQELYDELSDGARYYPFSVTRIEDCPSVLIETGYVTNDEECFKLIESSTHLLFGRAIADGIEKTLLN